MYPLNAGAFDVWGVDEDIPQDPHFNQEFYVFDISRADDNLVPVYVFVDLYSAGESFSGGTFPFMDPRQDDVHNKHYFDNGFVLFNMHLDSEEAESFYAIEGGTVNVSGSGRQYAITFDLLLDNGARVTGSYGGTFENMDNVQANTGPINHTIQLIKTTKGHP